MRETRVQTSIWGGSLTSHVQGSFGSGGGTAGDKNYHIKGADQQTPPTPRPRKSKVWSIKKNRVAGPM